jgi:hypothetical protein
VALISAGAADDVSTDILTIRSYNTFTTVSIQLDMVQAIAREVFGRAGIDARWRECRTALRRHDDPCGDVLGPNEVIVRVVATPRDLGRAAVLGDSYVEPASRGGVLATVFADRVHWTAARSGGDPAVLLGRAVAHEVGHLLVGTARHSRRGLMRAWWTDAELRRDREADWLFSQRQVLRIRQTLAARAAPATAPLR